MPMPLTSRLSLSISLVTTIGLMGDAPVVSSFELRDIMRSARSPYQHGSVFTFAARSTTQEGSEFRQFELLKSGPPDPDPTPPPQGGRRPGGSLGDPEVSCPEFQDESDTLTAIAPRSVHGQTISTQPTLWVYIPYAPEDVGLGRFSLQTRDTQQEVFQGYFHLPKTPGLVSIEIPASAGDQLQESAFYHWYFTLYCGESADGTELEPDDVEAIDNIGIYESVFIHGWLQRVEPTPERRHLVMSGSASLWYDAINHLAQELKEPFQGNHDNQTAQARWHDLLNGVELGEIADRPIVGPVVWLEDD